MSKKIIVIILITFLVVNVRAQSYQWITGGGSASDLSPQPSYSWEQVSNMVTDDNGNLYITATVGATNIRADTFYEALAHNHNTGAMHIFMASYKCDGTMRWAKLLECYNNNAMTAAPLTNESNSGLAYNKGKIYMAGLFQGGNKWIGYDTAFSDSMMSFILSVDTGGALNWIKPLGANGAAMLKTNYAGILAVDGGGYVHDFNYFGPGVALNASFVTDSTGTYDLKYDSTGNLVNAKRVHLDSLWLLQKVIFNKHSGKYYGLLQPNQSYWYNYHSTYNTALAAFGTDEKIIWSDTSGQSGVLNGLAYNGGNELYIAGSSNYPDTFHLGGLSATDTLFPIYNLAVVCRLDTNGTAKWIYNLQNNQSCDGFGDITILPNGRIATTGLGCATSIHATDTLIIPWTLWNPIFLVVDSSGHNIKLDQIHGSSGHNFGTAITSDAIGNVYIGGEIVDSVNATGLSPYHTNGGNTDFFVVKYGFSNCDSIHTSDVSPGLHHEYDLLSLYPNPTTDELFIEHAGILSTLRLFNMVGQQVYVGVVGSEPAIINTRNLVSGAYILQVTDMDGYRVNKTILKR